LKVLLQIYFKQYLHICVNNVSLLIQFWWIKFHYHYLIVKFQHSKVYHFMSLSQFEKTKCSDYTDLLIKTWSGLDRTFDNVYKWMTEQQILHMTSLSVSLLLQHFNEINQAIITYTYYKGKNYQVYICLSLRSKSDRKINPPLCWWFELL
jgi:hypothetical protein